MLALLTGSVVQALPCDYVVDFGSAPVQFQYKLIVTLESRDGCRFELPLIIDADTDAIGNRDTLAYFLRDNKWSSVAGTGSTLKVETFDFSSVGSAPKLVTQTKAPDGPTPEYSSTN